MEVNSEDSAEEEEFPPPPLHRDPEAPKEKEPTAQAKLSIGTLCSRIFLDMVCPPNLARYDTQDLDITIGISQYVRSGDHPFLFPSRASSFNNNVSY